MNEGRLVIAVSLLVDEFPGIRAVEAANPHRCNQLRGEVAEVHAVPYAELWWQRFPVRDASTSLAVNRAQGLVSPDVLGGGFRMTLDPYRAEFVVDPGPADPAAQRA